MGKVKYLISSFNNIQELVRFTDQKIAAVLVILTAVENHSSTNI